LHDGAVIIDDESIIAARCMLPLTSTVKFSGTNLGTRHRAGVGLSEQADAIVLIVSEETGFISIAEGGELTLDIPKNELSNILLTRLSKK
jgi:diadenylate cyclase